MLSENKVLYNIKIKYDLPTFSRDSDPPNSSSTNMNFTMFIFVKVFESDLQFFSEDCLIQNLFDQIWNKDIRIVEENQLLFLLREPRRFIAVIFGVVGDMLYTRWPTHTKFISLPRKPQSVLQSPVPTAQT